MKSKIRNQHVGWQSGEKQREERRTLRSSARRIRHVSTVSTTSETFFSGFRLSADSHQQGSFRDNHKSLFTNSRRLTAILRLYHWLATNGVKTGARLRASVRRHKLIVRTNDLHSTIAPVMRTGIVFNEVLQVATRNVNRLRPEILAYRAIKDRKCFSL